VYLDLDQDPVRATTESFFSLKAGHLLRTGQGRVELLLAASRVLAARRIAHCAWKTAPWPIRGWNSKKADFDPIEQP
jgi:hypothetical protein